MKRDTKQTKKSRIFVCFVFFRLFRVSLHFLNTNSVLKRSGLREANATRRVVNDPCISGSGVKRSGAARLGCEGPVRVRPEHLPRREVELVGYGRGGAAVALEDKTSDRVVLAIETDSRGPLDDDGDRECAERSGIAQAECLLVEPGTARIYHWSNGAAT